MKYNKFLDRCKEFNLKSRPIGAFEPGGYLGPEREDEEAKIDKNKLTVADKDQKENEIIASIQRANKSSFEKECSASGWSVDSRVSPSLAKLLKEQAKLA